MEDTLKHLSNPPPMIGHLTTEACPLCNEIELKLLVIREFEHCVITFNKYPYLVGHMMILSKRHVNCLTNCSQEERTEIMNVLNWLLDLLKNDLEIDSINVGINVGPNSGASIPQHLHVHVIPRLQHDMAFYQLVTKEPVVRDKDKQFLLDIKNMVDTKEYLK